MSEWEFLLYSSAPPWILKIFSQRHNVRIGVISVSMKNPLRSICTQIVITVYWELTMFKACFNVILTRIR